MKSRIIVRRSALGTAVVSTVGALVAGLVPAPDARAGIAFKDGVSSVTLTHDRDNTLADTLFRRSPSPVPRSSQIYPVNQYQLFRTIGPDADTFSQAFGSLGHITNPSTASFALATGTGVTQTDADEDFPGESSLRFNVDLRWNVLSGGFGPIATGFGSISAGGVVGSEGSASVLINLSFSDGTGAPLRSNWVVNDVLTTPGAFAKTYTTTEILGDGSLDPASELRVQGTIEFRASNQGSPSHITPLNAEVGGTPPTGTFYAADGLWHDPSNWSSPFPTQHQGETPVVVANAAGQRARFLEASGPRGVILLDTVTLGNFQIDSDQSHNFNADGGAMSFVSGTEDNAVLEVRSNFFFNDEMIVGAPTESRNPSHNLNVPVELVSSLDVLQNLELSSLTLASQVSGAGGITKLGPGRMLLTSEGNLYRGGTNIEEGILLANATGALGTGDATVSRLGQLDYNAKNAVSPDSAVIVEANGTLNLGIVPDSTENLIVRAFGAIRGDAAELRALTVDQNLQLLENAMIVHEGAGEASPSGLGTTPKYLFGIGSFTGVVPEFGTQSNGPWKGFGAGSGDTVLGGTPGGGSALNMAGDAIIAVLGDGVLDVNTQLIGASDGVLTKTGLGALVLNNVDNEFAGQLNVAEGLLVVQGTFRGKVAALLGAGVSGEGTIEGAVELADGAHLLPGDASDDQELNIGVLKVGALLLGDGSVLEFEFGKTHDRVDVAGNLVLDGILNIYDSQDFQVGEYPLFTFGGELTDSGLKLGFAPVIFNYDVEARKVGDVNAVFLVVSEVPEPGCMALVVGGMIGMGLRQRRR